MSISVQALEDLVAQTANSGNYMEAVDQLLDLLEKNNQNPLVAFYLGLILVRMKNYQSGIRYLELAKNAPLDPGQRLRCLIFLGKAYADVKAFSKAERAFREALQTGVLEPGAYSALGAIFFERNMVKQAIDALKKALEIDPQYPGALNNLGFILIETKKDIVEGINLCKKAVEIEPNNPAYRDSLAKAYMANSSYQDAYEQVLLAEKLDPQNVTIITRKKEILKKMES